MCEKTLMRKIIKILRKTSIVEILTPTLAGGLCEDHTRWNRFYGKLYRWIDCIFFVFILNFISNLILKSKFSKNNYFILIFIMFLGSPKKKNLVLQNSIIRYLGLINRDIYRKSGSLRKKIHVCLKGAYRALAT